MTERNLDADPTLLRLNREYSECIEKTVQDRWDGAVTNSGSTAEFCLKEKREFYTYLNSHFPDEFLNLMRVENYNFE